MRPEHSGTTAARCPTNRDVILWLRRVATREDDCDACIVEERIGRNVPDDMHDCEIGEEVES